MQTRSKIIEEYNELYKAGALSIPIQSHKVAVNQIPALNEKGCRSIFEIGCGSGILFRVLKSEGFEVSGTECAPHLLNTVLKHERIWPYMVHELADKVPDLSYDAVISVNVLDHLLLDDLETALVQSFRIARFGVLAVVNGLELMQVIKKPIDWWVETFKHFHKTPEVKYDRRGGVLISCWNF